MEFWGVEVKPGQTVKCDIEEGKLLHLSQAALGESKKGVENVPIYVKFNDQKLVLGTLSQEKCAQIQYDLVFEKEFELSHSSKNASVYFCGYKTAAQDDYPSGDEFSDSESEEEMQIAPNANGKVVKKEQPKTTVKEDNAVGKAKVKKEEAVKVEAKANDQDEDDEDDDEEDDSEDDSEEGSDDEMAMGDSDDEDGDESSEEEEDATPKKAAVSGKKRAAESVTKTPTTEKKAKLVSPAGQKTGGNGKKGVHTATPHPAKGGKTPANADKSKQQTPKSSGSASCKACSKSFNSDNALQAHNKAKHSASK